jgi:hypothetical protein
MDAQVVNEGRLQRWFLDLQTDGNYKIQSAGTGLCLDVWRASTANQVPLQQGWCNGHPHQRFQLRRVAHRQFEIRPAHAPDKCLNVAFASTAEGARVQQHTCVRQTNELFTIVAPRATTSGTGSRVPCLRSSPTKWPAGLLQDRHLRAGVEIDSIG